MLKLYTKLIPTIVWIQNLRLLSRAKKSHYCVGCEHQGEVIYYIKRPKTPLMRRKFMRSLIKMKHPHCPQPLMRVHPHLLRVKEHFKPSGGPGKNH